MYIDLNLYTRETEQSSAHKNISTLYGVGTQDLLSFIKCMNGMNAQKYTQNIRRSSVRIICERLRSFALYCGGSKVGDGEAILGSRISLNYSRQ